MERAAFLDRLRQRAAAAGNASRPGSPAGPGPGPVDAAYRRPLGDLVAAFTEEAAALGAEVRRVGRGGLAAFLGEVVEAHGVGRAVVSRDPETAGAASLLEARGVVVERGIRPGQTAAADLGVTGALCGIAATGSLVVAADRAGGRGASLLPPVHVALVRIDSLLATPAALGPCLRRAYPAGPPSQVVVITGPSRTGDIEMVLVRGVHGPEHLWVGLLEPQ